MTRRDWIYCTLAILFFGVNMLLAIHVVTTRPFTKRLFIQVFSTSNEPIDIDEEKEAGRVDILFNNEFVICFEGKVIIINNVPYLAPVSVGFIAKGDRNTLVLVPSGEMKRRVQFSTKITELD